MTRNPPPRPLTHANRRLAVLLVLLGLAMQGIAPYLPMPAMDRTDPDSAFVWLPRCLAAQTGADDAGSGPDGPHPGDCAACLVMQQAGSTQPPELPAVPLPAIASRAASSLWQQAAHVAPRGDGFSSRAPPIPA